MQLASSGTGATANRMSFGRRLAKSLRKYHQIYMILALAVVYIFIFAYIPMYGITVAFKDYKFNLGIFRSPWIGFKYFVAFFRYFNFWTIIRNTLIISSFKLIIFFPIPILFALMLNELRNAAFKRIVQTMTFLPHFISWVVVVQLLQHFLSLDGIINQLRLQLGLEKIFYMNDPSYFYSIMFFSFTWKNTGYACIIYLAALTGVDPQLYEAAKVDGAAKLRQIWHISLPSIMPVIMVLFILSLASVLSAGWDQIWQLRTPGNMNLADIIDTYVIEQGLKKGQFGYATAVQLFQSVIGLGLVMGTNALSKKLSDLSLF